MKRSGHRRSLWIVLATIATLGAPSSALARGGYNGHLPKPHCPAETRLGRFIDHISNRCPRSNSDDQKTPQPARQKDPGANSSNITVVSDAE